ncbi:MAG: hypothetical protein KDJ24_02665 [Gammaproteobacteria bacterium]|nr:hypothetical protein [Gammaproteobacteria bacterium]
MTGISSAALGTPEAQAQAIKSTADSDRLEGGMELNAAKFYEFWWNITVC